MNTQKILIDIINAIKPVTITGSGSDLFSKVCTVIKDVASGVQHPFLMFEDQCVYLYTGTHWMKVSDLDLKVFLRDAYQKISSDPIKASQRDMIKGLFKQFPYTVMNFGVTQVQGKINFLNGTLDLGTNIGTFHSSTDYFRYVLPYNYAYGASCHMFMKYLDEVLPDKKTQMVLAEYIAWLFLPDLKLEKVLFLYGSGCNGKSVFVDIIEALLGRDNVSHESLSDMCGEFGGNSRANLAGKLLNTCSDVAPNAFSGDIFKRIASGEPISAKILYKDVVTITDYARMIFCLNELPKTNDRSDGYFRRFLIVPFKVQIPKSKIDPKLTQKIISTELPGIMNWVLKGMGRLIIQQGFTESKLCQRELEKYRNGKNKNEISLILPDGYQK